MPNIDTETINESSDKRENLISESLEAEIALKENIKYEEVSNIVDECIKTSFSVSSEDIKNLKTYITSWDSGIKDNPKMIKLLYNSFFPLNNFNEDSSLTYDLNTLNYGFMLASEEPTYPLWKLSYLIHHKDEGLLNTINNIHNKEKEFNENLNKNTINIDDHHESGIEENLGSFGGVQLLYSKRYHVSGNPLTKSKGSVIYNGHKETFYSETRLPGKNLKIPGRHLGEDGTVRDENGYIVVACNYLKKGTPIMTSCGPGKVYDRGSMKGKHIDLYVNTRKGF